MKTWREPKIVDLGVEETKEGVFLSNNGSSSAGGASHSESNCGGCSSSSCDNRHES